MRNMLKIIAYLCWIVVPIILSILLIPVIQTAARKSIVGNYADGYELGKEHGKNDLRSGNQHNSQCPPNESLFWCAGYRIGYEAGWGAAELLRGK
jgi:hypothetical protein